MFVQYLLELNIKFAQYYVCVNVSCFVCVCFDQNQKIANL